MATAAAPQSTALSVTRQKVHAILTSEEAKRQIAPFLQPHTSIERVIATINQVAVENPEILECTPESIILAVAKGVDWDLKFGETVYLVPFNVNLAKKGQPARWEKRAKPVRDYKGDVELVRRSGAARSVGAHCFYAHEHFIYHQGTAPYIEHIPIVDEQKRGKLLGAYAWALVSQRAPLHVVVMSVAEIDKIRKEKSKSYKDGPLEDYAPFYPVKTAVHQLVKLLPKNERLRQLDREFEREEQEIPEADFEVVGSSSAVDTASQSASETSETVARGEAATPAATAATSAPDTPTLVDETTELDPATLTLEQARKLPLLGPPEAWGGKAGSLLGAFGTGALRQVRKWCVDTIEAAGDDPDKQLTIVAIDLIVADREQQPASQA